MRGPIAAGNGIPDGLGATLGRFFVRLARPAEQGSQGASRVPLELHFTSSSVTVDPVTCSEPSGDPCPERGKGTAAVAGYPTTSHGPVMALKLASALYLSRSDGYLPGFAVEVALEGSLYSGSQSAAGDPCDLRLFLGNPAYLLNWGADESNPPSDRQYRSNTGAGILLGDLAFFLFPGWLRGRVAENEGSALLAEFTRAEISPVRIGDETRVWVEPDFDAAQAAGLPPGVFGRIEVNYSGFATPSRIVPGAASNDVELHVTAVNEAAAFVRGDCDADGKVSGNVSDALRLLRYSFLGGAEPPCLAACDADGDGRITGRVADAVYLLQFQFRGGPAPPAPFPECGRGPEASLLSCEEPACP